MSNAPTNRFADPRTNVQRPAHVLLGVTGGVAAYKIAELVRLLTKAGVRTTVVMTEAAQRFVTPVTLQALSGSKVFTDLWDADVPNNMAHIELSRNADLILIAPATADFMAKVAQGLADDLLSTLCLARNATSCQLLMAPAMNREMWEHPATQRNVTQLLADGVTLFGPASGDQACGETGMGRMQEAAELFALTMQRLAPELQTPVSTRRSGPFAGKKAVVTAGPTFEAIDPVRGITNASSGQMGYAIAAALRDAGADVTLISGSTQITPPAGIRVINITSASQMLDAVECNIGGVDLFFAVAAVADYTPTAPSRQKMQKSDAEFQISLTPTVDILARVASRADAPFCVGFAAESDNIVENASKKRLKKRIHMIVANHAPTAIGAIDNEITIIDDDGVQPISRRSKTEIAKLIVSHAEQLFARQPRAGDLSRPVTGRVAQLNPKPHAASKG